MEPVELKGPDACLAFLIEHQSEWGCEIDIHIGGGQTRKEPLTLIGVVSDEEL